MRGLRIGLALGAVVVVAVLGPQARRAGAAGAPVAVDAAIVLAADVSRSIDDDEFALQRRGYADAIQSQQLLDAVSTGPHGAIALAYVEWAGDGEDKVVVDWAVIRNQADAQAFTAALTAAPRSFVGRTAIGTAIASVVDDMQGFPLIMNFLVMPLFFLSGSLFPLTGLPGAIETIARLDPLSYGIDGLRGALVPGSLQFGFWLDFGVLGVITIIVLAIGAYLFSKIEI